MALKFGKLKKKTNASDPIENMQNQLSKQHELYKQYVNDPSSIEGKRVWWRREDGAYKLGTYYGNRKVDITSKGDNCVVMESMDELPDTIAELKQMAGTDKTFRANILEAAAEISKSLAKIR